jgi:hypothetical protein
MKNRMARILQSGALSLFLFFTSLYYLTNAGDTKIGDESFMILIARKIVDEGQLGFEENEITSSSHWEDFASRGPAGRYYMKWGLGQSLVEIPFLAVHRTLFGRVGPENPPRDPTGFYLTEFALVMLCPSVISALGCVLFFLLGLRLGFSQKVSVLLTLVYGSATMVWPYSKSFMSETTLNVAILGGVYGALRYVQDKRKLWIFFSGACMGFAVLTKVTALVAVPVVIVYVLGSLKTKKSFFDLLFCFVPPFAVFIGLQAWHNLIRYGSIWEMGYRAGSDALGFSTPLLVGLWGLFLSPGKSFFLYAPVVLLAVFCLRSFIRYRRNEALLFLGIGVLFVLFHSRWWSWAGDWAWGPRFFLIITPYVIFPCGMLLEKWKGRRRLHRCLALTLILFSVGIQFLGVAVHPFSYIEVRGRVLDQLVPMDTDVLTYWRFYSESALAQFSPLFSHIAGNWWLLKHMLFSYDLWSDAPWNSLGHFDLEPPLWVIGNRVIPFWWPVGLPLFSRQTEAWVYPLAALSGLMLLLGAIRVARLLKRTAV